MKSKFFNAEQFKGDSIAVALKKLGYSMNTRNMEELEAAKEALIEQKPLVLAYVEDDVKDKMIAGEAALAVVWSGDAVYMKWENPDLEYVVPEEGSNLWFDAMVIPKTSTHQKEAEMFINLCANRKSPLKHGYIGFLLPNGRRSRSFEETLNDPTAYTRNSNKNCEIFKRPW
jgi:spermidine/putrescine transport system substrate-binding protein